MARWCAWSSRLAEQHAAVPVRRAQSSDTTRIPSQSCSACSHCLPARALRCLGDPSWIVAPRLGACAGPRRAAVTHCDGGVPPLGAMCMRPLAPPARASGWGWASTSCCWRRAPLLGPRRVLGDPDPPAQPQPQPASVACGLIFGSLSCVGSGPAHMAWTMERTCPSNVRYVYRARIGRCTVLGTVTTHVSGRSRRPLTALPPLSMTHHQVAP